MGVFLYGYRFTWRGHETSAFGFECKRASHESLAETLVSWGWTPPKWWEFWRWGERKPTEGAERIVRQQAAEAAERKA